MTSHPEEQLGGWPEGSTGTLGQRQCPRCGERLVERRNRKNGQVFLGCSGYPECRYATKSLPAPALATASAPASSNNSELAIAIRELTMAIRAWLRVSASRILRRSAESKV